MFINPRKNIIVPARGKATSSTDDLAESKIPSTKVLKMFVSFRKMDFIKAIIKAITINAIQTMFNAMIFPSPKEVLSEKAENKLKFQCIAEIMSTPKKAYCEGSNKLRLQFMSGLLLLRLEKNYNYITAFPVEEQSI